MFLLRLQVRDDKDCVTCIAICTELDTLPVYFKCSSAFAIVSCMCQLGAFTLVI
jgi:hypothetical protein